MKTRRTMASWVTQYLHQRRELGFKLQTEGNLLCGFAAYADAAGHTGPLTTELALRWARLPAAAAPRYWARRLEIVRCLARYLSGYEPGTEIPPKRILGPAHRRVQPHIYTPGEVSALLAACRRLIPRQGLRPHTYATLFGLLASTGLRIREALKLARDDVDWQRGLLTIRVTKFRKSRLVPLHPTAIPVLREYAHRRDDQCLLAADKAFFVSDSGRALPYRSVCHTFSTLRRRLGWSAAAGNRRPRIYDLRHTFACRRLASWQEQHADLGKLLPALSTYLGHGKIADTYWYLTGLPELFAVTADTFENYAHAYRGDRS